jgi:hypothetical protein
MDFQKITSGLPGRSLAIRVKIAGKLMIWRDKNITMIGREPERSC